MEGFTIQDLQDLFVGTIQTLGKFSGTVREVNAHKVETSVFYIWIGYVKFKVYLDSDLNLVNYGTVYGSQY